MKVTDVRLRRMQVDGKMRAYASVTLDDEFVVHEMRVIDGPRGLFVAMPSRRSADGEFRDIAHPITAEARKYIQTAVLEAFQVAAVQQVIAAEPAAAVRPAPAAQQIPPMAEAAEPDQAQAAAPVHNPA